jgi:hypothetical protein
MSYISFTLRIEKEKNMLPKELEDFRQDMINQGNIEAATVSLNHLNED